MTRRTALITGIRGQDGSYLAELLDAQGYALVGTSHDPAGYGEFAVAGGQVAPLEVLDLCDQPQIEALVQRYRPDEIYNLAARSSSAQLFDDPLATAEINGVAAVRFLEAIRRFSPTTRFCQAASSELFAGCERSPQDEATPFRPLNAYGAAKAYAANIVAAYRASHGLFATTAILFNHESPRRGDEYVTRKITRTVAQIALGQAQALTLGNLESRRDWGFAGDYADAMARMLKQDAPADYVIATGRTHSVGEFCEIAFAHVGLDYRDFVRIDPRWARRTESIELCGNPAQARARLGWQPSIDFPALVRMMVDADLQRLQNPTN